MYVVLYREGIARFHSNTISSTATIHCLLTSVLRTPHPFDKIENSTDDAESLHSVLHTSPRVTRLSREDRAHDRASEDETRVTALTLCQRGGRGGSARPRRQTRESAERARMTMSMTKSKTMSGREMPIMAVRDRTARRSRGRAGARNEACRLGARSSRVPCSLSLSLTPETADAVAEVG